MAGRISYTERSSRNKLFVNLNGFSDNAKNLALSRGAPRQIFATRPFLVAENLATITAEVGNRIKTVNKQKQITSLNKLTHHLMNQPSVSCFSSMPNDSMASAFALSLMMHNIEDTEVGVARHNLPLWFTVTGDFKDKLRFDGAKPSLLILSNIPENATPYKIEKVRDTLEQFSDVPRIVIITGCDPVSFFWTRLYYRLNAVAYLTEGGKSWQI